MNSGNTAEFQFSRGGTSVDATNTVLANAWTNANKVINDANAVINAAAKLTDKSYASGLIAHASILKALSLGSMSMLWTKVPDTIGKNVTFSDVCLAESEGFEPSMQVLPTYSLSRGAPSATRSRLQRSPAFYIRISGSLEKLRRSPRPGPDRRPCAARARRAPCTSRR